MSSNLKLLVDINIQEDNATFLLISSILFRCEVIFSRHVKDTIEIIASSFYYLKKWRRKEFFNKF